MYDELLVNIIKVVFVVGSIAMFIILGFLRGRQS